MPRKRGRKDRDLGGKIGGVFSGLRLSAMQILGDTDRASRLIAAANAKLTRSSAGRDDPLADIADQIRALLRLIRAYVKGEYRAVPWESIVLIVMAIVYLVSPLDAIPDVLGPIGLTDDASVLVFVLAAVIKDLEEFKRWELELDELPGDGPKDPESPDDLAKKARARRSRAARKFKPAEIRLLLVAEAPPSAPDRYFYFPDVTEHDSLFRYVARGLLGVEPSRENKVELLGQLQANGVFLIDLRPDPLDDTPLEDYVPSLIRRVKQLKPEKVILIKATVHDAAYLPMKDAGIPVVGNRVPFPGSGQQKRFQRAFADALQGTP